MNKKKLFGIILGGIAIVAGITAAVVFIGAGKKETLVQQQNYVASKLLELGDYEQGRILASQSEQLKENAVSKQLMVLAAGFQGEYEGGVRYAQAYLDKGADAVLDETMQVLKAFTEKTEALEEEFFYEEYEELKLALREDLLGLLLKVQNSIDIKKNSANVQAMLNMMTNQGISQETMAELDKDNSLLSEKVQTVYAIHTGDYTSALNHAEEAFKENQSFENRAMLANMIAENVAYMDYQDGRIAELQEELSGYHQQIYDLETKYNETKSEAERLKLTTQMEKLNGKITNVSNTIQAEPVKRAINFIETTTPITEKDTVAYKLELAKLYYKAKDTEKAKELVADAVKKDSSTEPLAMMLEDFITCFRMQNGQLEKPAYLDMEMMSLDVFWNRIAEALCFVEDNYYYYDEESFYKFVTDIIDALYNGLIIRQIDATQFPTVRVTVNVAMDLDEKLIKKNFSILEMGGKITDFRLLSEEEAAETEEMSVAVVVDRSGSMQGTPLEDTKKAVANFVKSVDSDIRLGLVAFDNYAELISPISENRTAVLKGVQGLTDGGGTSIYLGLQRAGQELVSESGKRVIILLSDGMDGDASYIDDVLDELKRNNIYVYTIGFGGADTTYLSYIASSCGGKFIEADSSEVLGEIYAAIGEYMVNDYIIEFTVVTEPENFSRNVNVSVDVNDAFAEKDYSVGVSLEDILEEQQEAPLADYFWQVGGSWMGETP